MKRRFLLCSALCLATVAGLCLAACASPGSAPQPSGTQAAPSSGGPAEKVTTVAQPASVELPAEDDYEAVDKFFADNMLDTAFVDEVADFSYRSASTVLSGTDEANGMFAPISLYYALAMTQEGAAGATRDEMRSVLGSQDADVIAQQCAVLYRLLATDQNADIKLANSLWMRNDAPFKQDFVNTLRDQYYASLFSVEFGTPEADQAMSQWIADNTEGTLTPQFTSEAGQLVSLINTVYFKSAWADPFDAAFTEQASFAAEGGETQADFMVQRLDKPEEVRVTDAYTRASLRLLDGSRMTFVLPAEGTSPHDILAQADTLEEAFAGESTGEAYVTYHVPKFAFDSSFGLIPALQSMGMESAFDDRADFSNLTDIPAYVSSVVQESHIGLDENGVEASAYTKVDIMEMSALPDPAVIGELDLNLNRPFLYEIRSKHDVPLFVGVCGNPAA